MDLERFVRAQDDSYAYVRALMELRAGCKRTHWMWFVFPQLVGLGRSEMAQRYGILGLEEARSHADLMVDAACSELAGGGLLTDDLESIARFVAMRTS